MKRLGVVGTLVWDRIWEWSAGAPAASAREAWGGIGYSLAALSAACPPGWTIQPLLRIGADLEAEARAFLEAMPNLELSRVQAVAEPTNRVELRYYEPARRCERLTGGVGPWPVDELLPLLDGLDALYLNFVSGHELELESVERLRERFAGPIYADVHSLLLGSAPDGTRVPRPLAEPMRWLGCFDVVQLNEDELRTLAGPERGFSAFAVDVLRARPWLLVVTRGAEGVAYALGGTGAGAGCAAVGRVAQHGGPRSGDPTGCGDVWGATLCACLAGGLRLGAAIAAARRAAVRKLTYPGAGGLHAALAEVKPHFD